MTGHSSVASTVVVVVMGVSGAGKTTVGVRLARELGWPFYEGDEFHPAENVDKMTRRQALTDDDRRPWLEALHDLIARLLESRRPAVLACSALRRSYRERLRQGNDGVRFVYLRVDRALAESRVGRRRGHFMPPDLVDSQFRALEEPAGVLVLDAARPPEALVQDVVRELGLEPDAECPAAPATPSLS
ncbi:MAG: gluconokinase [Gemmatimonadota bacterium]